MADVDGDVAVGKILVHHRRDRGRHLAFRLFEDDGAKSIAHLPLSAKLPLRVFRSRMRASYSERPETANRFVQPADGGTIHRTKRCAGKRNAESTIATGFIDRNAAQPMAGSPVRYA